jgi:hypothetical protein
MEYERNEAYTSIELSLLEMLLDYVEDTGDTFGAFRVATGDYTSDHSAECCGWLTRHGYLGLGDWTLDSDGIAERRTLVDRSAK